VPVLGRLLFVKKRRRRIKGALRAAAICKSNAYTVQISEKKRENPNLPLQDAVSIE